MSTSQRPHGGRSDDALTALGAAAGRTVVVVAGGDAIDAFDLDALPDDVVVVAADAGVESAQRLGLDVHLAVGDFDSVSEQALERAVDAGAEVERHPIDKDATDLELALDAALRHQPRRIVVLGGHGGRLDHFLANLTLLASPRYTGCELVAHMGAATVTVIHDAGRLHGRPGELVTLLPLHGAAGHVTTAGLRYPLDNEELTAGSTRGVSNELVTVTATVRVGSGIVLAVQPGGSAAELDAASPPTPPTT